MLRTHTCGQLRLENAGEEVTICGWVDTYRDHSGVLFVDLRDRYGRTQVVFNPDSGEENMDIARSLRGEFVISVTGKVAARPEGTANPKLSTGDIELRCSNIEILNRSLTPPFQPGGADLPGEDLRLKHRYIDLRRSEMQKSMFLRHRMIKLMRDYFDEQGFIDIETPVHVHCITIPVMGMPLLDNADFRRLAAQCAESGRYAFQFCAAPLVIEGGTGSPINPIAIF